MAALIPGPGVPEDAPGWAIRLEAKLDIAIVQHGQALDHLSREVENARRDHEREVARREVADKSLDERLDVLERSPFVTTKGMWTALVSSVAVGGGAVAIVNSVSNLF